MADKSLSNIFNEIDANKEKLAMEAKARAEKEREEKRKEAQNNKWVKMIRGGTDEDLQEMTPEELDLKNGIDMEHLTVIDGKTYRFDDTGYIISGNNGVFPENRYVKISRGTDINNTVNDDAASQTENSNANKDIQEPEKKKEEKIEDSAAEEQKREDREKESEDAIKEAEPDEQKTPKTDCNDFTIVTTEPITRGSIKICIECAWNKTIKCGAFVYSLRKYDEETEIYGGSMSCVTEDDVKYAAICDAIDGLEDDDYVNVKFFVDEKTGEMYRRALKREPQTEYERKYKEKMMELTKKKHIEVAPRGTILPIGAKMRELAESICWVDIREGE